MIHDTAVLRSRKHHNHPAGQDNFLAPYIPRFTESKTDDNEDLDADTLIYDNPGWVGKGWTQVKCRYNRPNYHLNVEGSSHFRLCDGGKAIVRVRRDGDPRTVDILDWEVLHGPVLVLALAMQGIWCLHASAVALNGRTTLFLGDSGSGKSTLAAFLARQASPAGKLAADDILPVSLQEDKLEAKPGFPQLKLSAKAQPAFHLPTSLAVERIFVLQQADQPVHVDIKNLPPRQAAQELLHHTAGTRLFAPDLLARHLCFCGQVAGKVPVVRLVYPHTKEAPGQVMKLLE